MGRAKVEKLRVYAKLLHGFISWENFFPGDSKFCAALEKIYDSLGKVFCSLFFSCCPEEKNKNYLKNDKRRRSSRRTQIEGVAASTNA